MTLGTTTPQIDYVEDGSTLVHAIPFQFELAADIVCSRISAGVETILTQGVNFTVSGGGGGTGTVTKLSAGVAGTTFRIKRQTSRAQQTDYTQGDAFPAETHEDALDRLSAVDQEQDVRIADIELRTIRTAMGKVGIVLTAANVNVLIGTDANGNLTLYDLTSFNVGPAGPQGPTGNILANGDYGDISCTGGVLSIDLGVVTLGKMANLLANSIIGNNTGAAAQAQALSGLQVTAMLLAFTGDSGAGGAKGLVPAPAAGDAAANKYLSAAGIWAVPSVGALANALTFNSTGGAAPGGTFNGSAARTIDYSSVGAAPARPAIQSGANTSFSAADADNNTHKVLGGAGQTLTLGSITAGTSFTVRATTAWTIACAGGLSKNGAAPGGVTAGNIAANSLITFLHEGSGVWVASGSGLT
jgi:hypothetical protein